MLAAILIALAVLLCVAESVDHHSDGVLTRWLFRTH
jgi:hypothetical protein